MSSNNFSSSPSDPARHYFSSPLVTLSSQVVAGYGAGSSSNFVFYAQSAIVFTSGRRRFQSSQHVQRGDREVHNFILHGSGTVYLGLYKHVMAPCIGSK